MLFSISDKLLKTLYAGARLRFSVYTGVFHLEASCIARQVNEQLFICWKANRYSLIFLNLSHVIIIYLWSVLKFCFIYDRT